MISTGVMHAGRRGGCDTSRRKWCGVWLLTSHTKKIRSLVSEMLRKRVTQERIAKISNRTTCRILYEFKGRRDSILTRGGSGKVYEDPGRTLGKSQNLLSIPSLFLKKKTSSVFSQGCCEHSLSMPTSLPPDGRFPNVSWTWITTITCCSENKGAKQWWTKI